MFSVVQCGVSKCDATSQIDWISLEVQPLNQAKLRDVHSRSYLSLFLIRCRPRDHRIMVPTVAGAPPHGTGRSVRAIGGTRRMAGKIVFHQGTADSKDET